MLSRKTIEAYLFFLLRHSAAVIIALMTAALAWITHTRLVVRRTSPACWHPYIQLYNAYRSMFGTAFPVVVGPRMDDLRRPGTVQKVDRITSSCCTSQA
jgi:hypothetical protein